MTGQIKGHSTHRTLIPQRLPAAHHGGSLREQHQEWQGVGTLGFLKCYGSIKEEQRHCSLTVLTKQTRFAPGQEALQIKDKL